MMRLHFSKTWLSGFPLQRAGASLVVTSRTGVQNGEEESRWPGMSRTKEYDLRRVRSLRTRARMPNAKLVCSRSTFHALELVAWRPAARRLCRSPAVGGHEARIELLLQCAVDKVPGQ